MSAPIELPVLTVFVPGKAETKGSTRSFAMRANNARGMRAVTIADNKPSQREWTAFVRDRAEQVMVGRTPHAGLVKVHLEFVLPRRASAPKTRTDPHTRKPDLDKLTRCVWDALTHVVFVDDSQVVESRESKREAGIGETPGCWITVWFG